MVYHVLCQVLSLNVTLFTILLLCNILLSCIKAFNAIMYIHELPMFAYNLYMSCLRLNTSCQGLCLFVNILVSNNFEILSCVVVHPTRSSQ